MPKVILTKGLPASGKTSWAKDIIMNNSSYKRVNKDKLREMVDFGNWSKEKEKVIIKLRNNLILTLIELGYNVIVDDTNLSPKHLRLITQLVGKKAKVEIKDSFLSVPVEECIKRDEKRENSVGKNIILKMADQNKIPVPEKLKRPVNFNYKPNVNFAVICDIDGTLAIHNGRSPYDYDKCNTDILNIPVAEIVRAAVEKIIIVSGREDKAKEKTEKWLKKNNIKYDFIYMRKTGDYRPDWIIKKEIYDKYIKDKFNIKFVLDDRNQVVKMWRSEGLTVFQVAEGNF